MRRASLATILVIAACGGRDAPSEAAFDPKSPGPVEMPGEPMSEPFPWRPVTAAAAVALVSVALVARRMRHAPPAEDDRPAPAPPPAAAVGPHVLALERIARLRAAPARTPDDHTETASIVRDYARDRFGVPAGERTTDELIAAPEIAMDARRLLADVLRPCDLVKFARDEPTAATRAALLDNAEEFVRGTTAS